MPRVDNSNEVVIEIYELEFDPDNPGETPPVDLCNECFAFWVNRDVEIEHPDYGDDRYMCIECGWMLDKLHN